MIKFITKAQQGYIAAKINQQITNWFDCDGGVGIIFESHSIYCIPEKHIHIKLMEADRKPGFASILAKTEGYKPAEYKGCTVDGMHVFKADDVTVIAQQKVAKPFLIVKGAQFRVKGATDPIRCYSALGDFLGVFLPMRPDPERCYDL